MEQDIGMCAQQPRVHTHMFWQMLVGQEQYTLAHNQMHVNKQLLMK